MSATQMLAPNARRYLEQVRAALADLPEAERDALLADVESHVAEVSEETGDELVARLGSPDGFAAELRAAAGLPPRAPQPAATPPRASLDSLAVHARRLRERLASLHAPADLAPAWWVLRGYVAAVVLAGGAPDGWLPAFGQEPDDRALSVLVLLAAVAASVWLGRRTRDRRPAGATRVALAGMNVVLLALAAAVAVDLERSRTTYVVESSAPAAGLAVDGDPVENIYAVDRDGRPLEDVRLYDQSGRPLALNPEDPDPARRVVRDVTGARADNAFPLRHLEPGSGAVAAPLAGFPRDVAPVATPPLRVPRPG